MTAVGPRGAQSGEGPAGSRRPSPWPLPRAVAVVVLLTLAALALRSRQGLDWDRLAEPVEVRWARVVLGSLVLAVVVVAGRRLLRRLREAGSARPIGDDGTEPEGEPFPFFLRVLGGLLVAAAAAVAWFIIRSIEPPPPEASQPATPEQTPPGGAPHPLDSRTLWAVLLLAGAFLLASNLVSRWVAAREAGAEDAEPDHRAEVAELVAAVGAAEEELARYDDPREAVLAAYRTMAGRLSSGLARRGATAPGSDTATELLDRAVAAGLVTDSSARTLTDLFREARFSRHAMGPEARRSAERCLAQVRVELAAHHG